MVKTGSIEIETAGGPKLPLGLAGQTWRRNETGDERDEARPYLVPLVPFAVFVLAAGEPCREIGDRPRIDVGLVPFLNDGEIGRSRGPGAATLPAIVPKKISGRGQNVGHAVDEIAVAVPSKSTANLR